MRQIAGSWALAIAFCHRSRLGLASVAKPDECRTLVERDMISLVALDLILRNVRARVMSITFVLDVAPMYTDNRAADASGLGIPAHTIANLEAFHHDRSVRCSGAGFTA